MPDETIKLTTQEVADILLDIQKPFAIEMHKKYVDAVKRSDTINTFISYFNELLSRYGLNNVSRTFLTHDIIKEKNSIFRKGFMLSVPSLYKDIKSARFHFPSDAIGFFGLKEFDNDNSESHYSEQFKVQLYNDIYLILQLYPFPLEDNHEIRIDMLIGSDFLRDHDLQLKKRHISLNRVIDKSKKTEIIDNFKSSMSAAIRDELDKQIPQNIEIPKEAIWTLACKVFDYLEACNIFEIDLF